MTDAVHRLAIVGCADRATRRGLLEGFRRRGVHAVGFADAARVRQAMQGVLPELLVVDADLPGAPELADEVRAGAGYRSVRLVVLAGARRPLAVPA